MSVGLSKSEQLRLAEIENDLSTEDPRLARRLARRPADLHRRRLWELAGAVISVAAMLAGGALIDTHAGIALIAFGAFGLLVALAVDAWELRGIWRRIGRRNPGPQNAWHPRPDVDPWYVWLSWWC